jgi:hypothetical protein
MPSRCRMSCPSAPVGGSRPNDQRVEIPTIGRDTFYYSDQGSFSGSAMIHNFADRSGSLPGITSERSGSILDRFKHRSLLILTPRMDTLSN